MAKRYLVQLPVTGFVVTFVTAHSADEAVNLAAQRDYEEGDITEWVVHYDDLLRNNTYEGLCQSPSAYPVHDD